MHTHTHTIPCLPPRRGVVSYLWRCHSSSRPPPDVRGRPGCQAARQPGNQADIIIDIIISIIIIIIISSSISSISIIILQFIMNCYYLLFGSHAASWPASGRCRQETMRSLATAEKEVQTRRGASTIYLNMICTSLAHDILYYTIV